MIGAVPTTLNLDYLYSEDVVSLLSEHSVPCSRCGCSGIHACIGRVLPPPTPEEEARLTKTLDSIFKNVDSNPNERILYSKGRD